MILSHRHSQEEILKVISLDFTTSDIIIGHVQKACGKTTQTKFITPSSKKSFQVRTSPSWTSQVAHSQ